LSEIATQPQLLPLEPVEPFVLNEADRKRLIWEVIAERVAGIPEEDLALIPHDGAEHHDHYLYGAGKKDRRKTKKKRTEGACSPTPSTGSR